MRRSSAFTYVAERSLGLANDFQDALFCEQVCAMREAPRNYIYDGGARVWCMAADPVDERFLLVGTSKSIISLYDLHELDANDDADPRGVSTTIHHYDTSHPFRPISGVSQQLTRRDASDATAALRAPRGSSLQAGITSIDWYPIDAGMFVSSSFDGLVKIWDANAFQVEVEFALNTKVFAAKFSPVSTTHTLIAAVTGNHEVRLCDMATESSIHSLLGHQDEVWALAWSRANEFQLCTGSRNGEVRMWDIRRSGATACLLCLSSEGQADVPGRSTLHTNVKPMHAESLTTASRSYGRSKRRRLDGSSTPKARTDPNMAATVSLARAHAAGVNALAYTPDGRTLLSSGHDDKLRAWNAHTGEHLFVSYDGTQSTQIARNTEMAVVQEGDAMHGTVVFHPNGTQGEMRSYLVHSDKGEALTRYTAHYRPITACVYRKARRELFTSAADGLIMKWRPLPVALKIDQDEEELGNETAGSTAMLQDEDADAWSDDDDGADGESMGVHGYGHGDVFVPPILRQDSGEYR